MINNIFAFFIWITLKVLLWLRYRIQVEGLDEIEKQYGNKGIIFLPNHPALIDPLIMMSVIWGRFKPRALVTEKQIKASALKYFWKRIRLLPLPDLGVTGLAGHEKVLSQLATCIDALKAGDNLLFYPAGRIYRSKKEKLRGNGGVARIITEYPEVKIVLARTTGLWGSEFSRAKGYQLSFGAALGLHFWDVVKNGIFFSPRRQVKIEFFVKPEDMPSPQNKDVLNRYLENFYNHAMRANTYVPYRWWERGGARTLPEPDSYNVNEDVSQVPADIQRRVKEKLHAITGKVLIRDTDTLGTDLGMDSLIIAEVHAWMQEEFGHEMPSPESLRTVSSLILAANGESAAAEPLKSVPASWFYDDPRTLTITDAGDVCKSFLVNAKAAPNRPVWADQTSGVFTNRKMVLAIMALRPAVEALPGERIGILMPATVYSTLLYLVCQFSGKVPVMINWTVGNRNMRHCIQNSGCDRILTAGAVVERLATAGVDFSGIEERFVKLEEIAAKTPLLRKIKALIMSRLCWRSLWKAKIPETAAIIFTSGSENLPKAVPLSHRNVIVDLIHAVNDMKIRKDDCLLGMLPPFHSFGLLLNTMFTCTSNIRVVYHPNPTEGAMLGRISAAYKVSFFCGTPTFIASILRNSTPEQMETLRLCVTGAEKCPASTLQLLQEKAPKAGLYEGYGISECGPIVSLNKPDAMRFGTIGKIIPCTEAVVVNEAGTQEVPVNTTGMLLVRGENIFKGYLNFDGPSPFVTFRDKEWYRTGDLVQLDEEGFVTFMGRLKRFVKIGGEMISLPAIEETIAANWPNPDPQNGPALAVEAAGDSDQDPRITLFTRLPLTKEQVNDLLREKGFSPIQFIRSVVKLEALPVLGTGKTDYRSLKKVEVPQEN